MQARARARTHTSTPSSKQIAMQLYIYSLLEEYVTLLGQLVLFI